MPDPNGSRKPISKNESMKKSESSKLTHSSSLKTGDKRKAEKVAARSPPRRRAVRRSRSSSSGTSDSSSSRSGSADSSDSDSSRSNKRSPQKSSQLKQAKGSDGPKSSSRVQASKTEVTPTSKAEDVRGRREPPKKSQISSDGPKVVESTRTDVQPRSKPGVVEDAKPTTALPQPSKASSGPGEDKSEPTKPPPVAKPSTKSAKPSVIEHDKATEERNKSPVNIPPFTRVLVEKLTRNVTKAHVTEIFSVWGEVSNVEMPPDRLHPEFSRSYAYVTYANPKCATDAVNYMNGGQVDGETIRVTEVFSRPSTTARTGADAPVPSESTQSRDRPTAKRDSDKPIDSTRGRKDALVSSSHHRADGTNDRPRDYDHRPTANEQDRRREVLDKERRDRDRERDRQRDRSRDLDRPRRARRGSSGSPFANRLGAVARQRSPVASSRYRRASPLSSRQDAARRGRSRSPKPTKPGLSRPSNDTKPAPRRGRANSRSSSSSSSDSGSSNSSSSSSHSGSSSSSSSSSSSRSRS